MDLIDPYISRKIGLFDKQFQSRQVAIFDHGAIKCISLQLLLINYSVYPKKSQPILL
jgi:hypothetical protein